MMLHIPHVLTPEQVGLVRNRLDNAGAAWVDGRVTAGYQGAAVKNNLQIDEASPVARELGDAILAVLERHPLFISAVLPARVYPPMFNRYVASDGMHFGDHVDNSVRLMPGTAERLRTDVSATLFLTDPADYDGGELIVQDTYGAHSSKYAAGDMVIYPGTSIHRVTPVTRGTRTSCFLWIQSMVRDDARRSMLFELDGAIQRLNATAADETARNQLIACYHNLVRMWAEV
jgi:PKHD-type hydroxylase